MTTLLALLALVSPPDAESEKARAEFKKAVAEMAPSAVFDAAERVARGETGAAVDVLLDGYGVCAAQMKALWEQKVRAMAEKEANADFKVDTNTNPPTIPASDVPKFEKYKEAEKAGQESERRTMTIEACKRAIVRALAKFRAEASVRELSRELAGNSSWQKRAGIAEALGHMEDASVAPALCAVAKKDAEPQVRIAAIDALVQLKASGPEVAAAIADQLRSEWWQLKSAAAAAIKSLGLKEAVEPLIEALAKNEGRLKHDVADALRALTGVDKHLDPAAWRAWWDGSREAVLKGEYKPVPSEAAGNAPKARTTFYGIPVTSRNVVFILDRSGSMAEPSEWEVPQDVATGPGAPGADVKKDGDRKIDIARWQLKRALAMMPDGVEFNVIFFSHEWTILSEKMLKLSAATRKLAYDFIEKLPPVGPTNCYDPLEKGLSFAAAGAMGDKIAKSGADTIYFLTDGMPNVGQVPNADDIVTKVRDLNKTRKVKIHTIGVFSAPRGNVPAALMSESVEGAKFLRQLAEDSGGQYTGAGASKKKP